MNKFFKQIVIFVGPLLITGTLFEILLRNIPNDYRYKKEFLEKNADSIKVLVLGSSYSYYGINPIYLSSTNSFNASHISQTLTYDYEILNKYSNRWGSLEYIVLPVSYFTLFGDLEKGDDAWRVKNYIIYYDFNTHAEFANHSELLSNKIMINIERIYSFYIKGNSNISCSDLGWGSRFNSKSKLNLFLSGKVASKRHEVKTNLYFSKNIIALRKIIEFAKSRNIEVILLTAPAFYTYIDNLDKPKLNRTITTLMKLDMEYDNVSYTNILKDTSFTEVDFYDADHLNEIGARKLTIRIDSIISRINWQRKLKVSKVK